jgi:hypothetical protein
MTKSNRRKYSIINIDPRLCQCGCGTFITTRDKRSQGRFVSSHVFRSSINRVPNKESLTEEQYNAIKKVPAWKAVYEEVNDFITESFRNYETVSYGSLEELDNMIYNDCKDRRTL